jgi:hypothetical protein
MERLVGISDPGLSGCQIDKAENKLGAFFGNWPPNVGFWHQPEGSHRYLGVRLSPSFKRHIRKFSFPSLTRSRQALFRMLPAFSVNFVIDGNNLTLQSALR